MGKRGLISSGICRGCGNILTKDNSYPSDFIHSGGSICKYCRNNKRKCVTYEQNQKYSKVKLLKLKSLILQNYGDKCECCNFDLWPSLSLDHIDGTGNLERQSKRAGCSFYNKLKRSGFPKNNIRTLCMNCNCSNGFHKFCTHKHSNVCMICNKDGEILDFYKENNTPICSKCLFYLSKSVRKYTDWKENKKYITNTRLKLLNMFKERKCKNCSCDNMLHLSIDHVNNDGAQERKYYNNNITSIHRDIISGKLSLERYRLLCYNCNCSLGYFGDFPQAFPKSIDKYINLVQRII